MATAQMAPIIIEPKEIMKVLIIEDQKLNREATERKLTNLGCSVDAVETPKEAAGIIEDGKYQMAIVDIQFDAPNISGDEFVRKNIDILSKGKIVAYTGHEEDILPGNKTLFHKIIKKARPGDPLSEFVVEVYKEVADEFKKGLVLGKVEYIDPDWDSSQRILIEELSKAKDKDKKIVWYKGKDLSANDLIDEVTDKDSEVGQSHIRMMLNWLNRKKKG